MDYVNPSFLNNKPNGGHRLVTAFSSVGRYSKPKPSAIDNILGKISQWRCIIKTDLTGAFYQIPFVKAPMRYCSFVITFRRIRVYTRCAMGMPDSETALEELMCRVLGELLVQKKFFRSHRTTTLKSMLRAQTFGIRQTTVFSRTIRQHITHAYKKQPKIHTTISPFQKVGVLLK